MDKRIQSGSKPGSGFPPIEVYEIGNPGQPTQLIVHNGQIYVYDSEGQTVIDGGIIQTLGMVVGSKAWLHDIIFTASDQDTATWVSGTIYFGDGTQTTVVSGTTGNVTAGSKMYIYYDGTDVLKKTYLPNFQNDTNLLIATVEPAATAGEKCIINVVKMAKGTISADQIVAGYMEFTRARGGSLILGGADNTNGTFSLRDASDVERISMDKDGMTVYNGKITIKDATNTAILDGTGLVSGNNFEIGIVTASGSFNTTSASSVDITDATLTTTNFSRSKRVLILAHVQTKIEAAAGGDYGGDTYCYINVDGNNYQSIIHGGDSTGGDENGIGGISCANFKLVSLGTGTHTIKLTCLVNGSNLKLNVLAWDLFYVVLGN